MKRHLIALMCALIAFCTVGCGFTQVPPGTVGIKFNASSGVSEKLLKSELVYHGWNDAIYFYPTAIKNASYVKAPNEGERQGDDSIRATTKEGARLPVDITVTYHVEPSNVTKAFENFGTEDLDDIQRVYIRSSVMYSVDIVSSTRSIFALTSKERATFGSDVKVVLAPILSQYGITVDDVAIGEVHPDKEIQDKVAESVAVSAELDTRKTELEKAKIDAKTVETNAKKTAELNSLLASQSGDQAVAQKRLEIKRKAIAKFKKAGGHLPLIGDGTIPFTDIKIQ